MRSAFSRKVCRIIKSIPPGRVTTYGIVARHANNTKGARQVARVLHSSSAKYDLPWHRVVNRKGKISLKQGFGYETQKELLQAEGVVFDESETIDFERFLWWPTPGS